MYMINKEVVAANILEARKTLGLSRIQFAKLLNVSRGTIYKWETNRLMPGLRNIIALCNLSKKTMDAFLDIKEKI